MAPRLGEILLHEGLLKEEELEEALESQVVHGGRLGTNLVELGLVSEPDLARMLGRLHRVQYASGAMHPHPNAVALVDPDVADRKDVLPMRVDTTRIYVACIDPHDLATFDALGFRSGKRVVPVIIPEFRMNQLLRKHVGAWRPVRPIDMGVTRPSRSRMAKGQGEAPTPDLMSEEAFAALYAKVLSGESAGAAAQTGAFAPGAEQQRFTPAGGTPVPSFAQGGGAAPGPPSSTHAASPSPSTAPPPARAAGASPTAPISALPVEPATLPPLSFSEAQAELAKSDDREDVARTILRFARGKFKRALLLSVQGPLVTGWHGAGEEMRDAIVRRVVVSLGGQSTFQLVCETRSHFVGPLRREPAAAAFYRALGGDYAATAVLLPLLVRGRVVHLLYVDDGPGAVTAPEIGELLILAQAVARSYEAMLRRRLT